MLILLKDLRKQLLWLWIGFSIPVLALLFLQTINGKFAGIEGTAWAWLGISLGPGLLLLLIGAIQNKNAGKFIQKFIFRIIQVTSILYLLLVLLTLFGLSAGTANQSIYAYFQHSYTWLLPFQALLMVVFSLLFFKKEALFQPDEKIILNHFEKRAEIAKTQNKLGQQRAFDTLLKGDFEELFKLLKSTAEETGQKDLAVKDVILIQAQFNEWKQNTDLNLVDPKEAQINMNRIYMALINLIEKI